MGDRIEGQTRYFPETEKNKIYLLFTSHPPKILPRMPLITNKHGNKLSSILFNFVF